MHAPPSSPPQIVVTFRTAPPLDGLFQDARFLPFLLKQPRVHPTEHLALWCSDPCTSLLQQRLAWCLQSPSRMEDFFPEQFQLRIESLNLETLCSDFLFLNHRVRSATELLALWFKSLKDPITNKSLGTIQEQFRRYELNDFSLSTPPLPPHDVFDACQNLSYLLAPKPELLQGVPLSLDSLIEFNRLPDLSELQTALFFSAARFLQRLQHAFEDFFRSKIEQNPTAFAQQFFQSDCTYSLFCDYFCHHGHDRRINLGSAFTSFQKTYLFDALEDQLLERLDLFFEDPAQRSFPHVYLLLWITFFSTEKHRNRDFTQRLIQHPALTQALILLPLIPPENPEIEFPHAESTRELDALLEPLMSSPEFGRIQTALAPFQTKHAETLLPLMRSWLGSADHPLLLESIIDSIDWKRAAVDSFETQRLLGGNREFSARLVQACPRIFAAMSDYWMDLANPDLDPNRLSIMRALLCVDSQNQSNRLIAPNDALRLRQESLHFFQLGDDTPNQESLPLSIGKKRL